jgi:hypothetical protein
MAAGRRLARGTPWREAIVAESHAAYADAADILGNAIPAASSFLAPGTWGQLRDRLVMRRNPSWLWKAWRDEACGRVGDEVLRLCDRADAVACFASSLAFSIELHRVAVEFVRAVEQAADCLGRASQDAMSMALSNAADILERLRPALLRIASDGGAAADVGRLDRLVGIVRAVAQRCEASESLPSAFESLVGVAGDPSPPSFLA